MDGERVHGSRFRVRGWDEGEGGEAEREISCSELTGVSGFDMVGGSLFFDMTRWGRRRQIDESAGTFNPKRIRVRVSACNAKQNDGKRGARPTIGGTALAKNMYFAKRTQMGEPHAVARQRLMRIGAVN